MINMTIAELKRLISDLPDNMPVVIPVIDEDDCNHIFGFRFVRTAGILSCDGEEYRTVLCLNAANGQDIADQVYFSGRDANVEKILFGHSKYDQRKENQMKFVVDELPHHGEFCPFWELCYDSGSDDKCPHQWNTYKICSDNNPHECRFLIEAS